jgi:hypothetical protein
VDSWVSFSAGWWQVGLFLRLLELHRVEVKLCTVESSNLHLPACQAFWLVPMCAGHTAKALHKLPSRLVFGNTLHLVVCCVGVHTSCKSTWLGP